MSIDITLEAVQRAKSLNDPYLSDLIIAMVAQPEKQPAIPVREGALTFEKYRSTLLSYEFSKKKPEEKMAYRVEQMKLLESADAEVPLADRRKLHSVLMELWHENTPYARDMLLCIIAKVPLEYGVWRALKKIFKEAEEKNDTEIFGALAARFDSAYASMGYIHNGPSTSTLAYLVRRGWRYLRNIAIALPSSYADCAVDFLIWYDENTNFQNSWIANHIFNHETKKYSKNRFKFDTHRYQINLKNRAFADLWRRSPQPLFALLERAQSDKVRGFAIKGLETEYRTEIRAIEASWIPRLVELKSAVVDEFVIWVLNNVPKFSQAAFRELGIHTAVLKLFSSSSEKAQQYAAEYGRTHARDLPITDLILLMNNRNRVVLKFAEDLLRSKDPRKEMTLELWGKVLETTSGNGFAKEMIAKHFAAKELTLEWFRESFLSASKCRFDFAFELFEKIHPIKKVDISYFISLIEDRREDSNDRLAYLVLYNFINSNFDVNTLPVEFLQKMLVYPTNKGVCQSFVLGWLETDFLKSTTIPVSFLKTIAYKKSWDSDPWICALKKENREYAESVFEDELATRILELFSDVRRFSASDLGFEWLMSLVQDKNMLYHNFATKVMIKTFSPADFAPKESASESTAPVAEIPTEITVDLSGSSFLFTGKMATMVRDVAENNVRNCGGSVASGVNAKLSYLVIGDDGSSLYGSGKKGSKQLKAEKLIEEGAPLKIISETAFLKMLSGKVQEHSGESLGDGCNALWDMLLAKDGNESLYKFAYKYFRMHHNAICLAETDRPVDEDMQIPAEFLTFKQIQPLFRDKKKELRDLALEFAQWEFARWNPVADDLIWLCESSDGRILSFVYESLFPTHPEEKKKSSIDVTKITSEEAYRFCKSNNGSTREIGMKLIQTSPSLRNTEELFKLTENSDRTIRSFAIRMLWDEYRTKDVSKTRSEFEGKTEPVNKQNLVEAVAGKKKKEGYALFSSLLRSILFELPATKLPKAPSTDAEKVVFKQVPTRKAKISLIEVLRDLALEDVEFAKIILPLFHEFMDSYGQSEQAACIVAVTRIHHKYSYLKESA